MGTEAKAVGYLELNSKQFDDAIVLAKKALVGLGTYFAAVKTVDFWKEGISGAIKFGNEAYFAAQKLNTYDPGKLLLVQKALEAGGLAAQDARQDIEDYAQAGRPLEQLFKGGQAGFGDALIRASREYGTQAAVLSKSAERFAFVESQIVAVGTKLQGFFLGLADEITRPFSALLSEIDKIDLVGIGQRFGRYITGAIDTVRGLIQQGNFLDVLKLGLKVAFQEASNYLLGAANSAIDILTDTKTWASIGQTLIGALGVVGTFFTSLFIGVGKIFVATIEAGLAKIAEKNPILAKLVGVSAKREIPQANKDEAIRNYGNIIGPQKIAEAQRKVDKFNAENVLSTDVSKNLERNENNSAIQALNRLGQKQLDVSEQIAKNGLTKLGETKVTFKKADLYDTDKDKDKLTELLLKARQQGETNRGPEGKINPLYSEKADPYHVIADSLARVGGGGRYVRTGLSIAEKAALDSLRYQQQIATNTAILAKRGAGNRTGHESMHGG